MRPAFRSTTIRLTAAAAAGILTLGLVNAPPDVAAPRAEVHAVQLTSASRVAPAVVPSPRPAAASPTAGDTTAPPDFLAFAASILEYLNSLGLGAGPGIAAIALSGFVVAFAATAYAWNGFADTVNPGLRFLHIPRVPKFPVCFAGQSCSSSAQAQARIKPTSRVAISHRSTVGSGRGTGFSGRSTAPTTAKAPSGKKAAPNKTAAKGTSKRVRGAAAH